MRKIIGWSLVTSPFILLTIAMAIDLGWATALAVWCGILLLCLIFSLGAWLINE